MGPKESQNESGWRILLNFVSFFVKVLPKSFFVKFSSQPIVPRGKKMGLSSGCLLGKTDCELSGCFGDKSPTEIEDRRRHSSFRPSDRRPFLQKSAQKVVASANTITKEASEKEAFFKKRIREEDEVEKKVFLASLAAVFGIFARRSLSRLAPLTAAAARAGGQPGRPRRPRHFDRARRSGRLAIPAKERCMISGEKTFDRTKNLPHFFPKEKFDYVLSSGKIIFKFFKLQRSWDAIENDLKYRGTQRSS